MIVVSNASPLISLAKIDQLDILKKLFTEIVVSEAVYSEAASQGAGAAEIAAAKWIKTAQLTVQTSSQIGALNIDLVQASCQPFCLPKNFQPTWLSLMKEKPVSLRQLRIFL